MIFEGSHSSEGVIYWYSGLYRLQGQRPEDGGSMLLQNEDIYLQVHVASQPRRLTLTKLYNLYSSNLITLFPHHSIQGQE